MSLLRVLHSIRPHGRISSPALPCHGGSWPQPTQQAAVQISSANGFRYTRKEWICLLAWKVSRCKMIHLLYQPSSNQTVLLIHVDSRSIHSVSLVSLMCQHVCNCTLEGTNDQKRWWSLQNQMGRSSIHVWCQSHMSHHWGYPTCLCQKPRFDSGWWVSGPLYDQHIFTWLITNTNTMPESAVIAMATWATRTSLIALKDDGSHWCYWFNLWGTITQKFFPAQIVSAHVSSSHPAWRCLVWSGVGRSEEGEAFLIKHS